MVRSMAHFRFFTTGFLLLISTSVLAQPGTITSTENQRVGKIEGTVATDDGIRSRYVNFVGIASDSDKKRVEHLAIGVGDVDANSDSVLSEGKAVWAFLTLEEAKQASKALQRMNDLANRKISRDIANKNITYRTAEGFSLQYQEFISGRLFTISAGNGRRKCQFNQMDYISLAKGCIDSGIEWMEDRPKPTAKATVNPHQGVAYTPKVGSQERDAIMNALRKPFMQTFKKKVIFKVDQLKVSEGWAFMMAQAVDAQGQPVGSMDVMQGSTHALLRKQKGSWKVLIWGGFTDTQLIEDAQEKYPLVPKAIF